jgi:hypothetical protein
VRPGWAFQSALVLAWRRVGTEEALELLWDQMAYATRYGRASLGEALRLDTRALDRYLSAVVRIIKNESGPPALHNE